MKNDKIQEENKRETVRIAAVKGKERQAIVTRQREGKKIIAT